MIIPSVLLFIILTVGEKRLNTDVLLLAEPQKVLNFEISLKTVSARLDE